MQGVPSGGGRGATIQGPCIADFGVDDGRKVPRFFIAFSKIGSTINLVPSGHRVARRDCILAIQFGCVKFAEGRRHDGALIQDRYGQSTRGLRIGTLTKLRSLSVRGKAVRTQKMMGYKARG